MPEREIELLHGYKLKIPPFVRSPVKTEEAGVEMLLYIVGLRLKKRELKGCKPVFNSKITNFTVN